MTRSVAELRALLEDEARLVAPDLRRRRDVVARVRRRRGAKVALTSLTAVAIVAGSVVAVSSGMRERSETRVAGEDDHAFEWEPGSYPVLASGTFEGARWTLEVVEDPDAAHPEDTESDNPEIAFRIEGADGASFETHGAWDVMDEPFHARLDEDTELLMGMVSASAGSVTAELGDGRTFEAAVIDGGGAPLPGVDYYLAFLPAGSVGQVVARDASDVPIARASLGELPPERPDLAIGCRPSARSYGPPARFRFFAAPGDYPVIARGTYDGRDWTLGIVEDPDAAHPEDTESDSPELSFEIAGGEVTGGSSELHEGWQVIDAPLHLRLDEGTEVVIGMVERSVDSLTVELGGDRSFPAGIFAGDGGPRPGSDYYLAFLPSGSEGEIVARDADGSVLGRVRLPGYEGPLCPSPEPAP